MIFHTDWGYGPQYFQQYTSFYFIQYSSKEDNTMHIVIWHHLKKMVVGWDSQFNLYLFELSKTLTSYSFFRNSKLIPLHIQL